MGYFSYPVPEFTWEHFWFPEPSFTRNTGEFARQGYDLIFHEDGGNWGRYVPGERHIPVVYLSIDSTLDEAHYRVRYQQAKYADLVLLDHDYPDRFASAGPPVRRLNYCVNDRVFHPVSPKRELDITVHCSSGGPGGEARKEIRRFLHTWAGEWDRTYRSGVLGLEAYATAMAASKVVVNWPRSALNRPHRIFDAMACGACVVTGPIPIVDGDGVFEGRQFVRFKDTVDLDQKLCELFDTGDWARYAEAGYTHVMEHHTWAVRAAQLRQMLHEELGL